MLSMTNNAAVAVRSVLSALNLEQSAGLRVCDGVPGVTLSAASAPDSGDLVLEKHDARVFVERETARGLDDCVLDAQIRAGTVRFKLDSAS